MSTFLLKNRFGCLKKALTLTFMRTEQSVKGSRGGELVQYALHIKWVQGVNTLNSFLVLGKLEQFNY